jgi:hypothetical protein
MTSQPDPIPQLDDEEITRIREVRHRISERFGHDPYRLVAYYLEKQRERVNLPAVPEPSQGNPSSKR